MSTKNTFLSVSLCLAILLIIGSLAVSVIILVYVVDIRDEGYKIKGSTETHVNGGVNNGAANDHHHDHDNNVDDDVDLNKCHDIAIVGAGPGGTYTAYKMRNQNLDIAIYEQLNRVGGRLFSVDIPGVDAKADLGGMRFRAYHKKLIKYMDELGIETREYTTAGFNDRIYHLRGHNFRQEELVTKPLPYDLRDNEKGKYYYGLLAYANAQFMGPKQAEPYETTTIDGRPLWKIGYVNEISKVLSSEALRYILDANAFDEEMIEVLNADWHGYPGITEDGPEIHGQAWTMVDGFQTFPKKLVEAFLAASDKHSLNLNHQVQTLELASTSGSEKIYKMKMKDMSSTSENLRSICAKKVILALSKPALERINWQSGLKGQRYLDNIDAVVAIPGFKAYFAYDTPWWRTTGNGEAFDGVDNLKFVITDLPPRQILDQQAHPEGLNHTGKSILLVYTPSLSSLRFYNLVTQELTPSKAQVKSDPGQYSNQEMVDLMHGYFARIFNVNVSDIPEPYAVVSQHWAQRLHGAGWHYWRPGYKWADVMYQMAKPSDEHEIYICGEAFSARNQGWTEGAIETCDVVLSEHFGL